MTNNRESWYFWFQKTS